MEGVGDDFGEDDGDGDGLSEGRGEGVIAVFAVADGLAWPSTCAVGDDWGWEMPAPITPIAMRATSAIRGNFQTAPVRRPGIPAIQAVLVMATLAGDSGTQVLPSHLHRPSGDKVETHRPPSQYDWPSGEIWPIDSNYPEPSVPRSDGCSPTMH